MEALRTVLIPQLVPSCGAILREQAALRPLLRFKRSADFRNYLRIVACCWMGLLTLANTSQADATPAVVEGFGTAPAFAPQMADLDLSDQAAIETAAAQIPGQFRGQSFVTRNFVVQAASPQMAQAVGQRAEYYRARLATLWLGNTLADWTTPCPIAVHLSNQAHGETSFMLPEYGAGPPSDWDMIVHGPADRLLDSVLPHEITHTIFASYFGQRLPRWVDEGACTTVEHPAEKEKIHAMLLRYLSAQQRRGIPFNRMFQMRDYPNDMLPLYAQGFSLAKYLIAQGGHQRFVSMIRRGLELENAQPSLVAWNQAMKDVYGYQDLSELQLDWLGWVSEGSDESIAVARATQRVNGTAGNPAGSEIRLASNAQDIAAQDISTPNIPTPNIPTPRATLASDFQPIGGNQANHFQNETNANLPNSNFYVRQMQGTHQTVANESSTGGLSAGGLNANRVIHSRINSQEGSLLEPTANHAADIDLLPTYDAVPNRFETNLQNQFPLSDTKKQQAPQTIVPNTSVQGRRVDSNILNPTIIR